MRVHLAACLVRGLTLLWCLATASVWAAGPSVVIVASDRSGAYQEAISALEAELVRTGHTPADIQTLTMAELGASATPVAPRLFVAVGVRAATMLAARDGKTPLIATLLPCGSFDALVSQMERKAAVLAGVCMDQPFSRQLELIQLALPAAQRVGVLWGGGATAPMSRLQSAAQTRGKQVVMAQVSAGESIFPSLQRVLEEADVLLALANPQIYNGTSIQNILLATVRARVPLMGFSPGYVQAGAAFALYSTPAMLGRQTAALVRGQLLGRVLPGNAQYPQEFEVGVNTHVARSLGLALDAATLTTRLRQLEPAP
jgi:putative tryptophan/tyrosine transport system substrate-binding protein